MSFFQEMEVFSQLKHDLQKDISNQKKTGNPHEMETLYKELTLAKTHLQQAEIDRENLRKQLEWFMKNRKTVMTDSWTPFPTMARQFSDSEEEVEDGREKSNEYVSISHDFSFSYYEAVHFNFFLDYCVYGGIKL